MEQQLAEVIEKGRLMRNRRQTERDAFYEVIAALRKQSSHFDKEVKQLKTLIEEERNDSFIDLLEGN